MNPQSSLSLKTLSVQIWKVNMLLAFFYLFLVAGPGYFKSSVLEFSTITSDPFDGTVSPISYIPNWLKAANQNKALTFSDIDVGEFVPLPKYDLNILENADTKNTTALFNRYTYTTLYMGSYRLNYEENDGSHCGIDIRAPIGTPVLSVANGVVIKAVDVDSSNGKYVVIRHDNVPLNGATETLYSSYLHLSSVAVAAGDKVSKGAIIGKSGMTGIATTPHLHFQIDRASASFHSYWPFTFKEAADLGLDFFGAINVGLGKENAMKYTTHPMNFVQNNLVSQDDFFENDDTQTTVEVPVVAPQSTASDSAPVVAPVSPVVTPTETAPDTLSSAPETPKTPEFFTDVPKNAAYVTRLKELVKEKIYTVNETGLFSPQGALLRKDAAIILARLYGYGTNEDVALPFEDLLPSETATPYIGSLFKAGIIGTNTKFRPNDAITRAEFITLLIRASGTGFYPNEKARFSDTKKTEWYYDFIQSYAVKAKLKGSRFGPNKAVSRSESVVLLDKFLGN